MRPPANYDVKIKGTQLSAFARDKYLWITLVGVPGNPLARTPRELALGGIDILFGNASGGYKIIDEAAATIGGKPAFALGFAGTLSGEAVEGRAAGVTASSTQERARPQRLRAAASAPGIRQANQSGMSQFIQRKPHDTPP